MKVLGDCVRYITEKVKDQIEDVPVIPSEIPSMKLLDAKKKIKEKFGTEIENVSDHDLSPEEERCISEIVKEEMNSDFVYITHYPVQKRPAYTYEDEEDKGFTKSFDLLFRGLEIATGGQRQHEHIKLVEQLEKRSLDPKKFSFYLQSFKYAMPPHGGFGMGLERLTALYAGVDNVKEASLFPRDLNRIDKRIHE